MNQKDYMEINEALPVVLKSIYNTGVVIPYNSDKLNIFGSFARANGIEKITLEIYVKKNWRSKDETTILDDDKRTIFTLDGR